MRAYEILTEWLIKRRVGNLTLRVSEHVQDQAHDRGVPWHYVERMLEHIPQMNQEKLRDMTNFSQFYLRDTETWTELGCVMRLDANDDPILHVNTVLRKEPGHTRTVPVLVVI